MPTYEDTALAAGLTEAQLDRIVQEFTKDSDVQAIASRLDIPADIVFRALEDGTLAFRAMRAKRYATAVRFMGKAIDRLQLIVESPSSSSREILVATKMLQELLGLTPPTVERKARRAVDTTEPELAVEEVDTPARKSLEAMLAELE